MAQTIQDVLAGTFIGRLTFKTVHGLWCADDDELDIPDISHKEVEYSSSFTKWDVYPSNRGGYWIRRLDSFLGEDPMPYWWMANMRANNREVLMNPGRDDWESFAIERHPDIDRGGYVIRSIANSRRYVTAHPPDHSVCLTADASVARSWETFEIEVFDEPINPDLPGLTPTPPEPGPGMLIQFLEGVGDSVGFVKVEDPATGRSARRSIPTYSNTIGCATTTLTCAMEAGLRAHLTNWDTVAIYGRGVRVKSSVVRIRQTNF